MTKSVVRTIGRVALWGMVALLLSAAGFAAALVYPGSPGAARSLKFQGYVQLPSRGWLSVLDYMTVSGRGLFVTSVTSGDVYRIALDSTSQPMDARIATLAGPPAAHGVAVDPTSGLAFVTRNGANTIDVFDPGSMRLVGRIPVADDADAIFYDPASKLIYADSGDPSLATLIDPASRTELGTIDLGGAPEFAAFDDRTKLIFQNLKDANAVAAVDVAKRSVVGRWPLDGCRGPSGMAIDPPDRRLFVVCSGNALLVVFSLDSRRVTTSVPIGGGPDSVAFDAALRRLYATGRSGVLTVIQQDGPDAYHQLDRISLHFGAHTLAVDPATHAVYVGYASLLVAPRLAVFTPAN
jgi:DNA-binding beta-propeller fold protein YncE